MASYPKATERYQQGISGGPTEGFFAGPQWGIEVYKRAREGLLPSLIDLTNQVDVLATTLHLASRVRPPDRDALLASCGEVVGVLNRVCYQLGVDFPAFIDEYLEILQGV